MDYLRVSGAMQFIKLRERAKLTHVFGGAWWQDRSVTARPSATIGDEATPMLDAQNKGPQCTACDSQMKLTAIEPCDSGRDLRTFTCPHCSSVQRHIIESTLTEAWPRKAVTFRVDRGRLIAMPEE